MGTATAAYIQFCFHFLLQVTDLKMFQVLEMSKLKHRKSCSSLYNMIVCTALKLKWAQVLQSTRRCFDIAGETATGECIPHGATFSYACSASYKNGFVTWKSEILITFCKVLNIWRTQHGESFSGASLPTVTGKSNNEVLHVCLKTSASFSDGSWNFNVTGINSQSFSSALPQLFKSNRCLRQDHDLFVEIIK